MTDGSTGRPTSPVDEHTQNNRIRGRLPGKARAPWAARDAAAPPQFGRVVETSGGGFLDNTVNNYAALSRTVFLNAPVDKETGEVLPNWDPTRKWILQQYHKKLNPTRRYLSCLSTIRSDRNEVEIKVSGQTGRCYYAGLMTCGSVWACPVCAAKIQQVRAQELRDAIKAAESLGLTVAMMTLTIPHSMRDDLSELLEGFTGSIKTLTGGRAWSKSVRSSYGIAGYVRALEVTFGFENGWHPHAHVLLFLNEDANLDQLEKEVFPLWEKAVQGKGLGKPSKNAFKLHSATGAHNYVSKLGREWGPAEELVQSHTKSARGNRYSPFDLLGEYAYGDRTQSQVKRFGALYQQYVEVFHGRRQLQWTPGFKKKLLGTEGKSDAEIADSLGQVDYILSRLTRDDWGLVLRSNMRGALLYVADLHGLDGVQNLLAGLRIRFGITEKGPVKAGEATA